MASAAGRQDTGERLADLFDAYHPRLFRLGRRLAGSSEEARDLVQETFLRAAGRPGSIPRNPPGDEAWLVRVLVNLVRDRRRRAQVRDRGRAVLLRERSGQASHEEAALAKRTVQKALARLPARRRAVVVLHELEGEPPARVAALLGISRVTVRWHLAVARKELAAILTEEVER